MKIEILNELSELENHYDIKILYAVESGSRAWGFESTDSDWDVRFIYIHKPEWYFKIDTGEDNIAKIQPNKLDFEGWDFKKALRLFRKSNPPLLEWLRSPVIYSEASSAIKKLRNFENEYINPKACIYHYLHMSEGNYVKYLQKENVNVKKYFYVLRPVLACEWILKYNDSAPMEFKRLLDDVSIEKTLYNAIINLLNRKLSGEEFDEEPKIEIINQYLENKIQFFTDYVKSIEINHSIDTDKLDKLFIDTIKEVWM